MKKILINIGSLIITVPLATLVACSTTIKPHDVKRSEITLNPSDSANKERREQSQDIIKKTDMKVLTLDKNGDGKSNLIIKGHQYISPNENLSKSYPFRNTSPDSFAGDNLECLPVAVYDSIVDVFEESALNKGEVGSIADELGIKNLQKAIGIKSTVTAYILDDDFYIEFYHLKVNQNNEIAYEEQYILDSDIAEMEFVRVEIGAWMARVRFFEDSNNPNPEWRHGKSHNSNYHILGYPLYEVSNSFSQFGVSSMPVKDGSIHEISYNHNA